MASQAVPWTALLLAGFSTATPAVNFPINSQVPPVSRVGEPFSFIFSPSTFSSSSAVTYTLANPPTWLSIDSDARRLFGTPREEDVAPGRVVGVPVNLVAADDSGSTLLTAILVVSRSPGPKVEIPFEAQVPDFGVYSSPSSLLSAPKDEFSFDLDPGTFSNPSSDPMRYYATMADNTPLPAWISFDPGRLSFSGRTPPSESLIQPPQSFSLRVIASDIPGFAGASLSFDIVVGNHQLVADETTITLRAVPRMPVSYTALRGMVKVDGKPAAPETVSIASTSNVPPWLSVDSGTWHIGGMAPDDAASTSFTITLRDRFSDVLNLTIAVEVVSEPIRQSDIFSGALPRFNITSGRHFSFDLRRYLVDPQNTQISLVASPSYSWIQFDTATDTLFGDAPGGLQDSTVDIQLNARLKDTKESVSSSLRIYIQATSGRTPGAHPTESPGDHTSLAGDGLENGPFNAVLLAVLLPVAILLVAAMCLLFWCFHRRKEHRGPRLTTSDISGPLSTTLMTKATPVPDLEASCSLPDPSKRFGKSFSADDVFVSEQMDYVESRNAFLTRPSLPQSHAQVWLLSPDSSLRSNPPNLPRAGNIHTTGNTSVGRVRPRLQDKINSSLSSITETSINDEIGGLTDERTLASRGNDNKMSFRDKIEVNIPRLPQTPVSTYTGTTPRLCGTDIMSTPQSSSPLVTRDTGEGPLRAQSRLSYYPPASSVGRFAWPWLRRSNFTRSDSRLGRMLKKPSKQPEMAMVGTIASPVAGQLEDGSDRTASDLSPVSPCRGRNQTPSNRPTTRRNETSQDVRDQGQSVIGVEGNRATSLTTAGPNLNTGNDGTALAHPDWRDTPEGLLGISYQDTPVERPRLRASGTWSTVLSATDGIDEAVDSPDPLQRRALTVPESTTRQNWRVLQESPVLKGWSAAEELATAGSPASASSTQLAQTQEREFLAAVSPTPSRPRTAREGSGLTRQSQSNGVSLRSEGSNEESDYAVYI
ncbi:polarity establishment/cellular polarization [Madurella fahalii]|uniref:Polarity establishment/cellular polarization n=1 Tax=Madurella fahalii TaxID=1157608 RepID=A0ABQ0G7U9_9PEZI